MKRAVLMTAAAVMALGVAAPANADFVRLGHVDVGYHTDLDTAYSHFGGRMAGLRFMAGRSDIYCRSIVVQFGNGERQNVFSGRLDEHQAIYADLRGGMRRVDNVRFVCRSDEFEGGRIFIEADVGSYGDEWRHDRDWDRTWSGMFGHHGDGDRGDWVSLGVQTFEGGDDRASTFAGWAGRHIDHIALRPVEADVRCNRVDAHFADGYSARLSENRVLRQGEMNVYDLPGYKRNVDSLYLRCHAIGNFHVTVEIYAHK